MIIEHGDIWCIYYETNVFAFAANSELNSTGEMAMDEGIALQVRYRIPGVARRSGFALRASMKELGVYGVLDATPELQMKPRILAFQTQIKSGTPLNLKVMATSADAIAKIMKAHRDWRIDLSEPLFHGGGVRHEDVYKLLKNLPNRLHVWRSSLDSHG